MKHWRKAVIALLVAPGMAALLLQILPREPGWYSALLLFVPLVLAAGASALAPEPGTLPPRLCRFRSLTAAAACYALGILLTVALNFSVSELFRGELVRVVAAFGLLLVFALFAGRSAGKSRKERWIIAAGSVAFGMAGGVPFGVALASFPGMDPEQSFSIGILAAAVVTGTAALWIPEKKRPLRSAAALWIFTVAAGAAAWSAAWIAGTFRFEAVKNRILEEREETSGSANGAELYREASLLFDAWAGDHPELLRSLPAADEEGARQLTAPELEPFFDAFEQAGRSDARWDRKKFIKDGATGELAALGRMSWFCRSRAAAFSAAGRPELVLPELLRVLPLVRQLRSQNIITFDLAGSELEEQLMRAAVEFGPVGPAYAADYRKLLHALEDDSLRPSGELELMTLLFSETKREFRLPGAVPENPLLGLLVSPASLNRRATLLETFASLQPELEEASRLAVLPVEYRKNVPSKDPVRSYLASTLLPYFFQREGRELCRIGIALKLFWSERGALPEKVTELVPAVLPSIPVSPISGEPFEYRREKEGFLLTGGTADGARPALRGGTRYEEKIERFSLQK